MKFIYLTTKALGGEGFYAAVDNIAAIAPASDQEGPGSQVWVNHALHNPVLVTESPESLIERIKKEQVWLLHICPKCQNHFIPVIEPQCFDCNLQQGIKKRWLDPDLRGK